MKLKKIKVSVPATTANLGSGFDALGLALSLKSDTTFEPDESLSLFESPITAEGESENTMPQGSDNLILEAMALAGQKMNRKIPGGRIHVESRIPLARGLGSSSAAIVSGIMIANAYCGNLMSRDEMLELACHMEGHPDNAAPAIMGGFCISLMKEDGVTVKSVPVAAHWKAVVAIPDFELETEKARAVLPGSYSRTDAVHNLSAVSFLVAAFATDTPELLKHGFDDVIHVPYRMALIPGGREVIEGALKAGAYGATISGSGPTIIAFTDEAHAEKTAELMKAGFNGKNIEAKTYILDMCPEGAEVILAE